MKYSHTFIDIGNMLKGSSRIYGENLKNIFITNNISANSILLKDLHELSLQNLNLDSKFILIGKGIPVQYDQIIKNNNIKSIIGRLHPEVNRSYDFDSKLINFFVAGSISEYNTLTEKSNKPVFILPQIELFKNNKYNKHYLLENIDRKTNKEKLILWHGDIGHAKNLPHNLINALNNIYKKKPFILNLVSNGKIKILNAEFKYRFHKYSLETISDLLHISDLGISTSLYSNKKPSIFSLNNYGRQRYKSDRILRYKYVSNPARAFLFSQHGVPFVCDENPEHFIFNDIEWSPICWSEKSWKNKINKCVNGNTNGIIELQFELFKKYHKYDTYLSLVKSGKLTIIES